MDIESVRRYCLSLPRTTEDIQWGNDLLFRIGGKIYTGVNLDLASPNRISFKCTPEEFAELTERDGIIPAPYSARYHWVAVQGWDVLAAPELKRLIRDSYGMVRDKLPHKIKKQLKLV